MYLTINTINDEKSFARDLERAIFHEDKMAESRLLNHVLAVTIRSTMIRYSASMDDAQDVGMETVKDVKKGYVDNVKSKVKNGHSAVLAFKNFAIMNAQHNFFDLLRHRRKHPVESLDTLDNPDEAVHGSGLVEQREDFDPVRRTENAGVWENVKKAINELPPEYRLVVLLDLIYDFKYTEIAQITGLSMSNVRNRVYRGKQKLRASPHLTAYNPLAA